MDAKTYVIFNKEGIKMSMKTDDEEQLLANVSGDDQFEEVESGFNPSCYKVENGKIVRKTAAEFQAMYSRA